MRAGQEHTRPGDEVDAAVIDRSGSIVYDQAENRLHTQKAIMLLLAQANE